MTKTIKQAPENELTNNTLAKKNAIALFGGTFDPIHTGHIHTAEALAKWLNINKVTLLPANIPPHKASPSVSSSQRAEMVELVCHKHPLFTCDKRELMRDKPSYTVDTLAEFRHEQPNADIYFFIGMDSLLTFTKWHQWPRILTLCHIVVCTRPGYDMESMSEVTKQMLAEHQINLVELTAKKTGGVLFAPPSEHNISSSELRAAFAQKQFNETWLTPEVSQYIQENKLYIP